MISFDLQVRDFPFNAQSQAAIEAWRLGQREYGTNWPVVYFIHNDDTREAYHPPGSRSKSSRQGGGYYQGFGALAQGILEYHLVVTPWGALTKCAKNY